MLTHICGMAYGCNWENYDYLGKKQVRNHYWAKTLKFYLINEMENLERVIELPFQVAPNWN